MKILVVDDEALLVKGIRFNLQNEGYEVITGSNGVEAVNAAMKDQPDLIVLDVMMPEMDGLEATEVIRKLERPDAATIPIVAATASAFEDDRIAIFNAGMNGYLLKPLNDESVYVEMKKQLFPEGEQ